MFYLFYSYGFVEFLTEEDADYSIKIMNMIKLYGKPIRVNKASAHQKNLDVGANIFIGNLDPEVDEKLLYDTFSAFGVILTTPKVKYGRFPLCLGITGFSPSLYSKQFKIASFFPESYLHYRLFSDTT